MGLFLPYQKYGTFFLPEFSARKMESGKFRQQPPFIRPRSARLVQAYISVIKRKITGPSAVYISVSWAKCFVSRSPTFPLKLLLPPPSPRPPPFLRHLISFQAFPHSLFFLFTLRGWTPTCAFYFQITATDHIQGMIRYPNDFLSSSRLQHRCELTQGTIPPISTPSLA